MQNGERLLDFLGIHCLGFSVKITLLCIQKALKVYKVCIEKYNIEIGNFFHGIGVYLFSLNDNTQAIRNLKDYFKTRQLDFDINDDDVAETQVYLAAAYMSKMNEKAVFFCYNEVTQIKIVNVISWRKAGLLNQYCDLESHSVDKTLKEVEATKVITSIDVVLQIIKERFGISYVEYAELQVKKNICLSILRKYNDATKSHKNKLLYL